MFRGLWVLVQTHKEVGFIYLGKTTKSCVCEITGFHGRSSEGTVREAKSLTLLSVNPIWNWRQYQYQRGAGRQGSIVSLFFDFSCLSGPFVNNISHYFSHWVEMLDFTRWANSHLSGSPVSSICRFKDFVWGKSCSFWPQSQSVSGPGGRMKRHVMKTCCVGPEARCWWPQIQ